MLQDDKEIIRKTLGRWAAAHPEEAARIKVVHICSPAENAEKEAVTAALGHEPRFVTSTIGTWDLNKPPPQWVLDDPADMIVVTGVFLCSPDPRLWFSHVAQAAPLLVMQDVVRAYRDGKYQRECASHDEDLVRYTFLGRGELARPIANSIYSMDVHEDLIEEVHFYSGIGYNYFDCRKFVAIMRTEGLRADDI